LSHAGLMRSLLFSPANEPRKVVRLLGSGADAVVLDLEDAVAEGQKVAARRSARGALPTLRDARRCVRVNAFETGLTPGDLDALPLPKAETVADVRRVDRLIAMAEAKNALAPGPIGVTALVETCAGIAAAAEIAPSGPRLITLILGSSDLGSDLGLPTIRGDLGGALAYGRAKLVYDARAAGLAPPLDGPFLQVRDQALLEQDCIVSRSLGHQGRVCIHPHQVPVVNRIYGPDPDEVLFARKVVDAFAEAERAGLASIVLDGVFVDYPIVHKGERIIALADAIAPRAPELPGANAR
jgi:citrate lyase subunit beta / citryl-CoA lyase